MKYQKFDRKRMRYPRVALTHADRNGAPVLIEKSSWRTVNGITWFFRGYRHFLEFRRYGS